MVEEVKRLVEAGYQEVVLTGIHLSSYGLDFPEGEKETLLDLIRAVDAVDGIRRIRLGSLEPGIITEEFAEAIAAMPKVCPHFHLSLQSGSNGTLKRMNRKYTAEEYKHKCDLLRKVYGNPALTTDVIVGFPQESEEEFEESRAFVEDIHFFETHIFKYSRREGTRAAAMAGRFRSRRRRSAAMFCWNWTRDGDRNIWKASSEKSWKCSWKKKSRSTASVTGRDIRENICALPFFRKKIS